MFERIQYLQVLKLIFHGVILGELLKNLLITSRFIVSILLGVDYLLIDSCDKLFYY